MLRSSIYSAGVVLLGATSFAQESVKGQLRPITSPVKYAGVYHVGTGTWTKAAPSVASATGAGIIYDNTCPSDYYGPIGTNETIVDEGRLPSTTSVVLVNANGLGNDSEVGTQNSYTVDGFQIGWCAFDTAPISIDINFYEAYNACAVPGLPTAAFQVTGLPGGLGIASPAQCWTADIDLCAASASFSMLADADGAYQGVVGGVGDTFGWSFKLLNTYPAANPTGLIIAGGRFNLLSPNVCSSPLNPAPVSASGSDGTIFDTGTFTLQYPDNADAFTLGCGTGAAGSAPEAGSGMGMLDQFRIEGGAINPGCYWFGGTNNPVGSYHMQLYSSNVELPSVSPLVPFCEPNSGGVIACPCANPGGTGLGCDNSEFTGGASITATGSPTVASDTLVFSTTGQTAFGTTVLMQGDAPIAAGVVFGQGVRCVGGNLLRLYVKSPGGTGGITAPAGTDPSVTAASATLGDTIAAGMTRYYMAYYRDPTVLGGCPAGSTFNGTHGGTVVWN